MKYGYPGADLSTTIDNFRIEEDKIIITYLDGSTSEVSMNEAMKKALIEQMISQAEERSESDALLNAVFEIDKPLIKSVFWSFMTDINLCGIIINRHFFKITAVIVVIITSYLALTNGRDCLINYDEIKELMKYDIYLAIRESLEEFNKENIVIPDLFKGVKSEVPELNINTLDDYSLRDIKRIRNNLYRFENGTAYKKRKDNSFYRGK